MENNAILDNFATSKLPPFNASLILSKLKQGGINDAYEVKGNKIVVKDHKNITLTISQDKEGLAKIEHNVELMNPYSLGVGVSLAIVFNIFHVLGSVVAAIIGVTVGTIAYRGQAKILEAEIYKILTSEHLN
jgi:hypothetical protein